jgi:hypothetical protein
LVAFAVGQLVQPLREALGGAAVVDEDDRRSVFLDELQELAGQIERTWALGSISDGGTPSSEG